VNISPTNQTLILAGEQWPRSMPRTVAGQAVTATGQRLTASGQALESVTIVAAGPHDTLLYVRADYAPSGDSALSRDTAPSRDAVPSRELLPAPQPEASSGTVVATRFGNWSAAGSYSAPLARYAQTQGLTMEPLARHVDVYA
jgi:hypothetical protein